MLRKMFHCAVAVVAMTAVVSWGVGILAEDPHNHDHTITFTVKGMCCDKEAAPCVKELEKVKGVAKVKADPKKGTITIEPKPKTDPSPKEIWEAVEKVKLTPVKLAMAHETFIKKPKK
jgi:copper chaperone CopZ